MMTTEQDQVLYDSDVYSYLVYAFMLILSRIPIGNTMSLVSLHGGIICIVNAYAIYYSQKLKVVFSK